MKKWYTADTHFNHAKILEYCGRPFKDVREMDRVLIENWNAVVSPDDLVIHVGDFGFMEGGDPRQYLKHLNGTIILVAGNHDRKKTRRLMPFCCSQMTAQIGEFFCLINHRPVYPQGSEDPFHDSDESVDLQKYDFVIAGHAHEKYIWNGVSLNIGVDVQDFRPISEERVIELLRDRSKTPGFRTRVQKLVTTSAKPPA